MKKPQAFELPEEMVVRFPFGYRVVIQKRRIKDQGLWYDFDKNLTGRIVINRTAPYHEQLDTLCHELHHAVTDLSGRLRKLQAEYLAWEKESE